MIQVTLLGGLVPITLRLADSPMLLSRGQTRKCNMAGYAPGHIYDAKIDGLYSAARLYYKPSFGNCYAIEAGVSRRKIQEEE